MNQKIRKPSRGDLLLELKASLTEEDIVIAALAGTTYECYRFLDRPGNLYAVGMGLVSAVALGLALALPKRKIIALDTDGGLLLSPSILPVIGVYKPRNLRILVFDNEQLHGSRGGPRSQTAHGTNLAGIAQASGIDRTETISDVSTFQAKVDWFLGEDGPIVLVAKVMGSYERADGPRMNGQENKYRLVRLIEETEKIQIFQTAK